MHDLLELINCVGSLSAFGSFIFTIYVYYKDNKKK